MQNGVPAVQSAGVADRKDLGGDRRSAAGDNLPVDDHSLAERRSAAAIVVGLLAAKVADDAGIVSEKIAAITEENVTPPPSRWSGVY